MANPTGNQNKPNPNQSPTPKPKFSRGILSWMLICFVLIMLWGAINGTGSGKEIPTFDDFLLRAQSHQFVDDNVTMENTKIFATIADGKSTPIGAPDIAAGTEVFCEIVSGEKSYYLKQLKEAEIKVTVNEDSGLFMHFLLSWGPMIFILFLIFFFISRSARGGGAGGMIGNFGKSKHKLAVKGENKITFNDVAGIVEAKAE
ncbi:MAG TPA: hypothetical protein EYM90_01720, partial [Phycisphaerales bacterium]|nr:hypothetical protein [Phycisphaerales bacterium]